LTKVTISTRRGVIAYSLIHYSSIKVGNSTNVELAQIKSG